MKKLLLATSLLLSSSSAFAAEPIEIFGINAGMSKQERVDVLSNKLTCHILEVNGIGYCAKDAKITEDIKTGAIAPIMVFDEIVMVADDETTFGCKTYSSCKGELREYAMWIVNNTNTPSLEYDSHTFKNPFTKQWQNDEKYVGIGDAGDKIVVKPRKIILHTHTLGETIGL